MNVSLHLRPFTALTHPHAYLICRAAADGSMNRSTLHLRRMKARTTSFRGNILKTIRQYRTAPPERRLKQGDQEGRAKASSVTASHDDLVLVRLYERSGWHGAHGRRCVSLTFAHSFSRDHRLRLPSCWFHVGDIWIITTCHDLSRLVTTALHDPQRCYYLYPSSFNARMHVTFSY